MVSLSISIWDSSIHLFQLSSVQFSCKTGNRGTFSLLVYTPCSDCIVSKLGWTHSYNIRSLWNMHPHTLTKCYDCVWWSCFVLHLWVKAVHELEASAPNIPWNKLETSLTIVSWRKKTFPLMFFIFLLYFFLLVFKEHKMSTFLFADNEVLVFLRRGSAVMVEIAP